jgi:hypothetical protein
MQKLKLDLDALAVESFGTNDSGHRTGTVGAFGRETFGCPLPTANTCDPTCPIGCGNPTAISCASCAASCAGTCVDPTCATCGGATCGATCNGAFTCPTNPLTCNPTVGLERCCG